MLGINQLDFFNYSTVLKGDYRKGVHKLRALLKIPVQASEFVKNIGGVSVVFGVPLEHPDRNSDTLYAILAGSEWCDMAVETWLHAFYEFDNLDELLSDLGVCQELAEKDFLAMAVGASKIAIGKLLARLVGLDPAEYEDITALAANETVIKAVAASEIAMTALSKSWQAIAAVHRSPAAFSAIQSKGPAWAAFSAANTRAVTLALTSLAALNPQDYPNLQTLLDDMEAIRAICANPTALTAIFSSDTARNSFLNKQSLAAIYSTTSSAFVGKALVKLVGLNPDEFSDCTKMAASESAMKALAANAAAMRAAAASIYAMNAIAASATAMKAVAASSTSIRVIEASSTAKSALYSSPLKQILTEVACANSWTLRRAGKIWLISIKQSWGSDDKNTFQHHSALISPPTISNTYKETYNRDCRVDRFMDSITNYSGIGGLGNVCTYTFIPCT